LNHLSWARALGCPTGLLALQGDDDNGRTVRAKMAELGVATRFVRVAPTHTTSVSHILSEPSGERTIIMAPASTSQLTGDRMATEWSDAVAGASMITTEISQLPLSGVGWLLDAAARLGVPSLLDVDVTPTIATTAARLGTMDQVKLVVPKATVVKLTASAAAELLSLFSPSPLATNVEAATQQIADALGVKMVVITDG